MFAAPSQQAPPLPIPLGLDARGWWPQWVYAPNLLGHSSFMTPQAATEAPRFGVLDTKQSQH